MTSADLKHRLKLASVRFGRRSWLWLNGPGRRITAGVVRRIRLNLAARRLLSLPHLIFAFWIIILLWGERWKFDSKVETCDWKSWENWPKEAAPHHLILIADPQITDPHSYPGRPWPLSSLTVTLTDNYLRRGFKALQSHLSPDSIFFLGDLFDGGREWKTRHGHFTDPKWGYDRSNDEKKWVKTWHRKYGEDYWIREYQRFSSIYFDNWKLGGDEARPWQRGKKLVASLPGNHDIGFGAQVQVAVRERFAAYFGDVNRVDIIGNHSIVSVDTVSLSADTSQYKDSKDLEPIYGPVNDFLEDVKATKRKLVAQELQVWHDTDLDLRFDHKVEEVEDVESDRWLRDPGENAPDLPTLLLTHVPLYRPPGTPCGPMREHWPPTKPPKGQTEPVIPDNRNAITVTAGYQYQNVLNEADSVKLIKSVGNVVHAFSGDDHDYCELTHSKAQEHVKEITVKSIGMNMGVPTPGFLMVSMYNPVDAEGKPIPGAPKQTLQTHLCLLPNQFHTYMTYAMLGVLSLAILAARALLVPALHLAPFALEPESGRPGLPMYKDKVEPPLSNGNGRRMSTSATSSSNGSARWASKKSRKGRGWGWSGDAAGPRINLDDTFYDSSKDWKTGKGRQAIGTVGRELWTTTWRVTWLIGLMFVYLTRKG